MTTWRDSAAAGWAAGVVLAVVVVGGVHLLLTPPKPAPPPPLAALPLARVVEPVPPPPPPSAPPTATTATALSSVAPTTPQPLTLPALAPLTGPGPALQALRGDLVAGLPAVTLPTVAVTVPTLAVRPPDEPPVLIGGIDLERFFPREARLRGLGGFTRLRLTIDATGTVTQATVDDSTPAGVFDAAAHRLALSLRYRPAQRDGGPVAATLPLTVQWTIR